MRSDAGGESLSLIHILSARENLALHLAYMGAEGKIDSILREVGLGAVGEKPVMAFSVGMRQRLAIARAMIHLSLIHILTDSGQEILNKDYQTMLRPIYYLREKMGEEFDSFIEMVMVANRFLQEFERSNEREVL